MNTDVNFDNIIETINPNDSPKLWTDEMVKQAMIMALNSGMIDRQESISDIRTLLLSHPNQQMIKRCCMGYLEEELEAYKLDVAQPMSAKDFWKNKFDEYPQNDADKLAVVMMAEYREYLQSLK